MFGNFKHSFTFVYHSEQYGRIYRYTGGPHTGFSRLYQKAITIFTRGSADQPGCTGLQAHQLAAAPRPGAGHTRHFQKTKNEYTRLRPRKNAKRHPV